MKQEVDKYSIRNRSIDQYSIRKGKLKNSICSM